MFIDLTPFIPLSLKGEGEGDILKGSALQTSLLKTGGKEVRIWERKQI